MLTQHLRELEADRLLERVCVSARPLHVEYRLAPMGRRLLLALQDVRSFSVDLGFN
ncbi:winged helix-turn-helix transcriptional regulator [Pseudomonas aeruginosa]